MANDRRAHAVVFGFDFQVNAAIVLMLENMEDLKSLRLEGNYEDIELELENKQYILAQAKAVENASSDFRNVRKNMNKSLITLSEAEKKVNVKELIMITNSPDPLKDENSKNLFTEDAHRSFASLPEPSKEIIQKYLDDIELPLDTNKFMIQILPFETDNEKERYKIVRRAIDDFVGELRLNIPGIAKEIMTLWQDEVFVNSSKQIAEIKLKKADIIWPILVTVTDVDRFSNDLEDYFDPGTYEEIVRQYKNIIDSHCERVEFFTKVLWNYNSFKGNGKLSEKPVEFAMERWKDYLPDFEVGIIEEEVLEGLIKVILYTITRNRIVIDRIKKGVKL